MKLISFRIQKYKRIDDTGIIQANNLVVFMGKNESGKSSIFTALAKLNSSSGMKFNKINDIPHKEYLELENKLIYPVMAQFELDENDELFKNIPKTFVVERNYENKLEFGIDYENFPSQIQIETEEDETEEDETIDLKKLEDSLPYFIYVEDYDRLQGTFDVPEFLKQLEKDKENREIRINRCIFDYVGLNPNDFVDLIDSEKNLSADEKEKYVNIRKFKTDNASEKMTTEFNKRWLDDQHYKFQYRPDGQMLKVWISDEDDDTGVDITLRSKGFQYFFAFFLIYKIENDRYRKNTIVLMDEPGLYFHGTLQEKLIDFFKELSTEHQLFYSTHSPFLVDKDSLVKIVYIDKITGKTNIVDDDAISLDEDSIFPLKINWYTSQYQKYVLDKPHVLVEGELDVNAFEKINTLFEKENKECFLESVIFVAGEGDRSPQIVSILKTNKLNIIYFLDGDEPGLKNEKRCKNKFNLKGITTKDYSKKEQSTLEDLFPTERYLDAVYNVYEIKSKDGFVPNENKPITAQVKSLVIVNLLPPTNFT